MPFMSVFMIFAYLEGGAFYPTPVYAKVSLSSTGRGVR
jgi:hypothetical protein